MNPEAELNGAPLNPEHDSLGQAVENPAATSKIRRPITQRLLRKAPAVLAVVGLGFLAVPKATEAAGTWDQYRLAAKQDRTNLIYKKAAAGPGEDANVSFQLGIGSSIGRAAVSQAPTGTSAPGMEFKDVRIRIPAIGVDQAVWEGVDKPTLRKGPGHYPGTPLPGQTGNVIVSGHRTTYTKPFADLDRVPAGGVILLDTPERTYTYRIERNFIVDASNVKPLEDANYPKLTLSTCHPKGSARQRIIIEGRLAAG